LRLRPILMTSFAFIFGVVPLVVATGAGAEMRRSLGQAAVNAGSAEAIEEYELPVIMIFVPEVA